MIEINKKIGKKMIAVAPELVKTTVHKRHYYMVDCKDSKKLFNELNEEVVLYEIQQKYDSKGRR